MSELCVFVDRPHAFWIAMGPRFADAKIRRDMPYLCDKPDLVWIVGCDDAGACTAFLSFESSRPVARIREIWIDTRPGAPVPNADRMVAMLLDHLRSARVDSATATLKSRGAVILERAGFRRVGLKGSYTVLEVNL